MWLLITFIVIWALSPGPVMVMTLHETRKHGLLSGIAVSSGATVTSILMVIMAIILHSVGFSAILDMDSMTAIEQIGALGIILMGLNAGYKSLIPRNNETSSEISSSTRFGFAQGMMVMATYIPQALIYYSVVIPQTVEPQAIMTAIIILGGLKVALIFGWHSLAAIVINRAQTVVKTNNKQIGKFFEVATACLIVALGINILI